MSPRYLFLIVLVYYISAFISVPSKVPFRISFLDVGQGDSILIESGESRALVDGGADYGTDMYLSPIFWNGLCSFDILVLSHFHADHIGVLDNYVKRCNVGVTTFNDIAVSPTKFYAFREFSEENMYKKFLAGEVFRLNDVTLIFFDVSNKISQSELDNLNNSSIIVLVKYKDFEALLLGDSEVAALSKLDLKALRSYVRGDLDVLKVSHHGSNTGLYPPLVEALSPKHCVISVGRDNKFGHPHEETIIYLEEYGCEIRRTDEEGSVVFEY